MELEELLTQRNFEVYCSHQYLSIDLKKVCHTHFNAHKLPKPVTPTIFMLDKNI